MNLLFYLFEACFTCLWYRNLASQPKKSDAPVTAAQVPVLSGHVGPQVEASLCRVAGATGATGNVGIKANVGIRHGKSKPMMWSWSS